MESNLGAYKESILYKKITQPDAEVVATPTASLGTFKERKGKSSDTTNGLKHYESLMK